MNCTKKDCTGRIEITHVYTVKSAKYQRGQCKTCKTVYTLQTLAVQVERRGDGAKARARRAAAM